MIRKSPAIDPKCKTCNNEGVAWLLSPCPDCKEGKKVKSIGDRLTKTISGKKILSLNKAKAQIIADIEDFLIKNRYPSNNPIRKFIKELGDEK